jgi:hypothetical protein
MREQFSGRQRDFQALHLLVNGAIRPNLRQISACREKSIGSWYSCDCEGGEEEMGKD